MILDDVDNNPPGARRQPADGGQARRPIDVVGGWHAARREGRRLSRALWLAGRSISPAEGGGVVLQAYREDLPGRPHPVLRSVNPAAVGRLKLQASRMYRCGQEGQVVVDASGPRVEPHLCHVRGCPVCAHSFASKRRRAYADSLAAAAAVEGVRAVFVTRTQRARSREELAASVDRLQAARTRYQRAGPGTVQEWVRSWVAGGLWALEATFNRHAGWWHAHFHEVWLVRASALEGHTKHVRVRGKRAGERSRMKIDPQSGLGLALAWAWQLAQGDEIENVIDPKAQDYTVLDDPSESLGELLKYPCKYQSLEGPQVIEAFLALRGRRTCGTWGALHSSSHEARVDRAAARDPWAWDVGAAYRQGRQVAREEEGRRGAGREVLAQSARWVMPREGQEEELRWSVVSVRLAQLEAAYERPEIARSWVWVGAGRRVRPVDPEEIKPLREHPAVALGRRCHLDPPRPPPQTRQLDPTNPTETPAGAPGSTGRGPPRRRDHPHRPATRDQ